MSKGEPPEGAQKKAAATTLAAFARVKTWVFDLDNTLYPPGADLWPKIDQRITAYMIDLLGLDGMSARALQKYYYQRYGTTLRGLMDEHDVAPDAFLRFVHDIDRSSLKPDPELAAAIDALTGRKLILTNGSREHALRTAAQLGLDHLFDGVFDIKAADYLPKPAEETYRRFFDTYGVDPASAAMFEDIAHNLEAPHRRGMITVLVVPPSGARDHRETWEIAGAQPPHVDFVTDDLTGFLRDLRH